MNSFLKKLSHADYLNASCATVPFRCTLRLHSSIQISVVAVLSTLWYLIGGWLDGVQDLEQTSWTLAEIWDWIIAFPWIPAVYSGIISTGFCSWVEVYFHPSFYSIFINFFVILL